MLQRCLAVVTFTIVFSGLAATAYMVPQPTVNNCTLHYFEQYIDHFSWHNGTYSERYFKYDKWYKPGGPIFFYVGNEANVEIFANWTGLMWEHGEELNALLIFAEHRYFGTSQPCAGGYLACGDYLSTEQAMADYAALITDLRTVQYPDAGIAVTFGGSYGGMLSAWMRMRYPGVVAGAIASSAPIGCMAPDYKTESYWAVVSRDATAAGGAAPECFNNVHQAIEDVFALLQSDPVQVQNLLHLCKTPNASDTDEIGYFIQAAFDGMAMGNYPFPTYYISGAPGFPAPAWPMRVACEFMATAAPTAAERITNLYQAISVVDNLTAVSCYHTSGLNPSVYSPKWDYMVCTNQLFNEQPYFAATGPPADMFYAQPQYNAARIAEHCERTFGKTPRIGELWMGLGVPNIAAASNIIFANGLLDPWHSGGILTNVSDTVLAYIIPEGGHHLDLFFSTPQDPQSVIEVRKHQMDNIRTWMSDSAIHGHQIHHKKTKMSSHERATFRRRN